MGKTGDVDAGCDISATSQPDMQFQNYLREGRFMAQRNRRSGKFFLYPRVAEPGTGSQDLEWAELSGRGIVYSVTTIRPRPPAEAYNVSLIELDEGPRIMSRVEGIMPFDVGIGMMVKARIIQNDEQSFIVFDRVISSPAA